MPSLDFLEGMVGGILLTILFVYIGIPASDALSRILLRLHARRVGWRGR